MRDPALSFTVPLKAAPTLRRLIAAVLRQMPDFAAIRPLPAESANPSVQRPALKPTVLSYAGITRWITPKQFAPDVAAATNPSQPASEANWLAVAEVADAEMRCQS